MPYFKLPKHLATVAEKQGGYLCGANGEYPFNEKGLMRVPDHENAAKMAKILNRFYGCTLIDDPKPEEGKPHVLPAAPQPTIPEKSIKTK